MKFPSRSSKQTSGEFSLFRPATRYTISHHVITVTQAEAVAIAEELDGPFQVEVTRNTMSTGFDPDFLVIITHTGIPNEKTVPRAIRAIQDVAGKHRGRHVGWDRLELPPEQKAGRGWLEPDDDDDDSDPMSLPAPLKS